MREQIERRIGPLLEQMAPGQAELKYVDVRVTRPTALPAGAAPGFEELTPGTEFVAERAEVALTLDSKLPAAVSQGPQEPDQEPARRARRARSRSRETRDRLPDAAAPAADAARDVPYGYPPPPQPAPQRSASRPRRSRTPPPRRRRRRPLTTGRTASPGSWRSRSASWARSSARSRVALLSALAERRAQARHRRAGTAAPIGAARRAGRRHAGRGASITCPTCGARCARIACSPAG